MTTDITMLKSDNNLRIGIVVWALTLNKGGIERVGADLANAMSIRGHHVTIYCHDPSGVATPRYSLAETVELVRFDVGHSRESRGKLRETLLNRRADVLIAMFSWRDLLWFPIVLQDSGLPLIISEHNHPNIINNERWNRIEREAALSSADSIHVLLNGFTSLFPKSLQDRIRVIPNAVPRTETKADPGAVNSRLILLAVGRFDDSHKQFSLLIEAFSFIHHEFNNWELHIYGEGRDGDLYKETIDRLQLLGRVYLKGVSNHMDSVYSNAHLFCIPSRYEGFGLVTVEAHRNGLPVVGFANCTGTNEIVIDGVNGLLAKEMTSLSLSHSLSILMRDSKLRCKMGDSAVITSNKFDPEAVYDQWEALIFETASKQGACELSRHLDIDENIVHRLNLKNISLRDNLFSASSGAPLFATTDLANTNCSIADLDKIKKQRDSAWAKIEALTVQRDTAWKKIERMRIQISGEIESIDNAVCTQQSAINNVLSNN